MVSIDTFKSSFSLSNFSFSIHLTAPELEPPGSPFLPFPAVCTLAGCKRLVQGRKMGRSRPAGLAVVLCVGPVVRGEKERWEGASSKTSWTTREVSKDTAVLVVAARTPPAPLRTLWTVNRCGWRS